MMSSIPMPHYDVRRARHALAALLRDPDDLPQVFTLIDSMSGTAPHRLLRKMKRSESGARILSSRPDIVRRLADRDALRALPEGTLGRAYLAFVESEGISPEGIREASVLGQADGPQSDRFEYLRARMRDTHDLWHAVTGYHGDVLGELSLLAFTLAQHWNPAVATIVVAGVLKGLGKSEIGTIVDGFRRGRRAAWLPAQEWESMLDLPLSVVRSKLRLGEPPSYVPIRTRSLREEGILSS